MQTHNKPKLDIPRASSIYPDDVSPPDSPRPEDGARSSSPNVSPITDAGSGHRLSSSSRTYASNIPLPKQKAGGTTAFISGWKEKIAAAQAQTAGKMKWDAYSGEPSGSEKARPGQVVPGLTNFDQTGSGHASTVTTTVTSQPPPTKTLFGTTLKKTQRKEPSLAPSPPPKEPWRGASGRAPIIEPVESRPDPKGTKKSFPTPSQRRQKQGIRQAIGLKSPEPKNSPTEKGKRASPSPPPASEKVVLPRQAEAMEDLSSNGSDIDTPRQEYTQSPLSIPPRIDSMVQGDQKSGIGGALTSISTIPENQEAPPTVRKVSTEPVPTKSLPTEISSRTNSLPPTYEYASDQFQLASGNLDMNNEPASRFSATTYNTVIQDMPDTPKQSFDEPPLPASFGESILNRKRPVPTAGVSGRAKPPSRKPTPSEITANGNVDGKALPQQPAEESAVDRVVLLEAKLNSLHKRKQNLQTVIHELTNVVQPSSAAYDVASRQEIKKTVEGLNVESAAVAKEIHETGMKLHRALKKRDESSSFEPTGLWVRRVTG